MKKGGKYAFNPDAQTPNPDLNPNTNPKNPEQTIIGFNPNVEPQTDLNPDLSQIAPKKGAPKRNKYAKMVAPTLKGESRVSNVLTLNVMKVAKKSMLLSENPKDRQSVLARMSRISCWGEDLELREKLIGDFSAGLEEAGASNSLARLLERLIQRCRKEGKPLTTFQIENLYSYSDRLYVVLTEILNKFRILDDVN